MDKINIIVFSKDRACQLDLHLRSLAANFKEFQENEISVVYDFSDLEYIEGYQKLIAYITELEDKRKHKLVNIIFNEENFTNPT